MAAPGSLSSVLDPANFPQVLKSADGRAHVELRYDVLDVNFASRFIRSPTAGANVLFLGSTRNNFDNRPVSHLAYQAYPKLALNTLLRIATEVRLKHNLERVIIVHRLGEVPIEEESIIVGISSGHRGEGWKGAEEMLERVKERAEIWKQEWFADEQNQSGQPAAIWKANKDTDQHGRSINDG
ncbi:hypothetical protein H2198_009350 [Neophaeococcomyces mojaviensis]|uniref:Uncharacterized protein n=1 Tax=Neophaeococcomyces mojaviensis TaxID=3383035 RepID=A0ACC2ZUY1_9EURO|nr:hypothetical protein H2198_009350 [Knufia sp. JES_112]